MKKLIRQIYWRDDCLYVLDQRLLPHRRAYLRCATPRAVAEAIRVMALRGAPLIGGAAGYGYALAAKSLPADPKKRARIFRQAGELLKASRPTAVNLTHAVDRMRVKIESVFANGASGDSRKIFKALKAEADAIFAEDIDANRRMAQFGSGLLKPGSKIITYCNTGALATCGVGTAFGVIAQGFKEGKVSRVYPCETRPYLQGSRLTLWELAQAKIPATLITDNMAAHIMSREKIDAVIVGADRIAANADVANKIGTYGLAIAARHHGVSFYVAAPSTTVDFKTPDGAAIPIEERSAKEVTEIQGASIAPKGAKARHPAFDVTPHQLITAIITERGIVQPADETTLKRIIQS